LFAANAATRYRYTIHSNYTLSGSSYILADATRGLGVKLNMKKDAILLLILPMWIITGRFNLILIKTNGALMRWGAEKTYDYFSTKHTRNSYDNAGAVIKATYTMELLTMRTGMLVL
jgi:hypothetical protein